VVLNLFLSTPSLSNCRLFHATLTLNNFKSKCLDWQIYWSNFPCCSKNRGHLERSGRSMWRRATPSKNHWFRLITQKFMQTNRVRKRKTFTFFSKKIVWRKLLYFILITIRNIGGFLLLSEFLERQGQVQQAKLKTLYLLT